MPVIENRGDTAAVPGATLAAPMLVQALTALGLAAIAEHYGDQVRIWCSPDAWHIGGVDDPVELVRAHAAAHRGARWLTATVPGSRTEVMTASWPTVSEEQFAQAWQLRHELLDDLDPLTRQLVAGIGQVEPPAPDIRVPSRVRVRPGEPVELPEVVRIRRWRDTGSAWDTIPVQRGNNIIRRLAALAVASSEDPHGVADMAFPVGAWAPRNEPVTNSAAWCALWALTQLSVIAHRDTHPAFAARVTVRTGDNRDTEVTIPARRYTAVGHRGTRTDGLLYLPIIARPLTLAGVRTVLMSEHLATLSAFAEDTPAAAALDTNPTAAHLAAAVAREYLRGRGVAAVARWRLHVMIDAPRVEFRVTNANTITTHP
ncbi:hypothetical protein [Nocardia terpenica]|uniref:Uncharacterized protein n=1 Tax=Nocardia terpenica TaxID=455432 RepID=A0A6G9ZDM2_9NOCA|nr:hypothetical protein [Nocardia terpenica]QIS23719.1 hypothetical protein F6W96_41005 [Nocardia terpenica]